ncbi:hypothetical protein Lalb_Chr20g0113271 [Lupinus albus]|uniref:Uncharacterized protein n=1 Tax=Lupinus albus TaxID=3870 RepID=A0A6A4NWT8_LUPAL|nr:hypothetical protein Lalb_Chr20g0113271 [Lupinus albus]
MYVTPSSPTKPPKGFKSLTQAFLHLHQWQRRLVVSKPKSHGLREIRLRPSVFLSLSISITAKYFV